MRRTLPLIITLVVGILVLLIVNLLIGSVRIPMTEVCRILLGAESNEIWTNIVYKTSTGTLMLASGNCSV